MKSLYILFSENINMNQLRINKIEYPNESLSLHDEGLTYKTNCPATSTMQNDSLNELPKSNTESLLSEQQTNKPNDSIIKQQKEQLRKQKYNAYMKSYRERKKKELEERLRSITITFNNQLKSYDKNDIQQVLFNCINLLINIINTNINKFTKEAINEINQSQSSNDIIQFTNTLISYIDNLIQPT